MKINKIIAQKGDTVFSISEDKSVHDAAADLVEHRIGALLVLDSKNKLAGIISERDILNECVNRANLLKKTKIKTVMSKKLIIGTMDDDVDYIMGVMTNNRVRHIPIMEGETIKGIVSIGDVVKHQLHDKEYENHYLQQYMFGH